MYYYIQHKHNKGSETMNKYAKTVRHIREDGSVLTSIYTALPDHSREGLYKVQVQHEGETKQHSFLYGKSNQEHILKMIESMQKVK